MDTANNTKFDHITLIFGLCLFRVPNFGSKIFFKENAALSRSNLYRYLASCQNLENTNDRIPRKRPDIWKDGRTKGRKDGQALFYKVLPATAGGPIKEILVTSF